MNPIKASGFKCGECGDLHSCEYSALECCAPDAEEVDLWKCTECLSEYDDEDQARYCCLDEDIVLPATPGQLEAAGQQRLAL
jgi:hypothetical protein